jgi:predicted dehydrogenase
MAGTDQAGTRSYAIVGAGSRALEMYARPLVERFRESARLSAVCDPNGRRAAYVSAACGGIPTYTDFDQMLREAAPDCVIVATVDRYHHEYIIRALEAGCGVITEKPMTIDAEKCNAILTAERRTGRRIVVTFNARFTPYATRIKELLRAGAVGTVLHVDLEWFLDRRHGADYFRRWHRRKENSGGLLVHKATHHFDMVNWWLEAEPASVYAQGTRRLYGPTRSERGVRCSTCAFTDTCEFYVDYRSDPRLRGLYFEAEQEDGYFRDGCVFSPEIDIEDTMSLSVRYATDTLLTYSLVAYSPYEGWRATFTGTEGRMEVQQFSSGARAHEPQSEILVTDRRGDVTTYQVPTAAGTHGGSDALLVDRLFGTNAQPDPLGYMADSRAGAMSLLIGAAANRSMSTGGPVSIEGLLHETVEA